MFTSFTVSGFDSHMTRMRETLSTVRGVEGNIDTMVIVSWRKVLSWMTTHIHIQDLIDFNMLSVVAVLLWIDLNQLLTHWLYAYGNRCGTLTSNSVWWHVPYVSTHSQEQWVYSAHTVIWSSMCLICSLYLNYVHVFNMTGLCVWYFFSQCMQVCLL